MLIAVKQYGYMENAKDNSEIDQFLTKLQNLWHQYREGCGK